MDPERQYTFPADEPVATDDETGRVIVLHTDEKGTRLAALRPESGLVATIIDRATTDDEQK